MKWFHVIKKGAITPSGFIVIQGYSGETGIGFVLPARLYVRWGRCIANWRNHRWVLWFSHRKW